MEQSTIRVAVDGPAGAGKSSVARSAAQRLGFVYVDTGAIYRTVALAALRCGFVPDDEAAIRALLPTLKLRLQWREGVQHIFLGDEDVSQSIRTSEVSEAASRVSALLVVRDFLMQMQRDVATEHNVIMDGRDIGTVVLPDASVKIFLTASAEARALRRMREMEAKGIREDFETTLRLMRQRDERDSTREVRPLRVADDAVILDTSDLSLEESIDRLIEIIREKVAL